tara:strand:- start:7775 stop:8032 length:258 start_codon:yes stop_codon:yes gene_type:complete
MKATIVNFRRNRHTVKPNHMILKVEGTDTKEDAAKLVGKEVSWKSPAGKEMKGKIAATHGNSGCVRAIFDIGLPGQSLGTKIEIK